MKKMTIEEVEKNGWLAYKYIRGSQSYGLATPESDTDYGGVFILPEEYLKGLRSNYVEQVSDEKSDIVYYEIGRWMELLLKGNPNVLESLFIPEDCIIGNIHPSVQLILDNKEKFLTKECFNPLVGYAKSQIIKHKGLNKKINIPEDFQRKDILDFCYTFNKQGSQPIKDFLEEHNLDQKYCGLVKIPNAYYTYGVYYDFAAYFKFENKMDGIKEERINNWDDITVVCWDGLCQRFSTYDWSKIKERIKNKEFFHYKGIVEPDEITKSNEVRLSSIPKGEETICFMSYNRDAYVGHCIDYKEWTEWKKNRNPVRYENNKGHQFDSKNMMHSIRLMTMGIELAEGKGFNVRRTGKDREHLLAIRNHEMSYEDIMQEAEELNSIFNEKVKSSTLPDSINYDFVNNLLIQARNIY